MPSCEKCWRESASFHGDHAERYSELLEERRETPCTPEQQAGDEAEYCRHCERQTVHQYAKTCVICGRSK